MSAADAVRISDDFFAAAARNDLDAVRALYREDVTIWHNYDDADQTMAQNLATLGSIPERYDDFGYEDIRTVAIDGGFLRQHVIRASRGGKTALVPAIVRAYVDGGLIHRIEEYFDRGQLDRQLA